jgi:UDP-glucose 4-epimerase
MFKDKILLITGGTGSFGNELLDLLIDNDLKEIRIFSRDEKKQDDMKIKYNNPKLKFYIGDVRDYQSIYQATKGVDYVFHAAALKQVPSCERCPIEVVKTNVLGTENVLNACIENKVKRVVCLSTDKAVAPINVMGMTKALMEKIALQKSREQNNTVIIRTRYGNVMNSRGSVIPLFKNQETITITNPDMTRFMMSLKEAIDLVIYAFENGEQGDLFVQKSPSCTIDTLAKAICKKYGDKPIEYINNRGGEKIHETLISNLEMENAIDLGKFYRINESIKGNLRNNYSSDNTIILDIDDMVKLV